MAEKARTRLEKPDLASSFGNKILHLGGKSASRRLFPNFGRPDLGQRQVISKMSGSRIMAGEKPEPG
jgi:hypothetical protein